MALNTQGIIFADGNRTTRNYAFLRHVFVQLQLQRLFTSRADKNLNRNALHLMWKGASRQSPRSERGVHSPLHL